MEYPVGCNSLGNLYAKGQGVRQSYTKAAELYKKSCEGYAGGCFNLGVLYAKGQGVRQNFTKAKELFGKTCFMRLDAKGCELYNLLSKAGY